MPSLPPPTSDAAAELERLEAFRDRRKNALDVPTTHVLDDLDDALALARRLLEELELAQTVARAWGDSSIAMQAERDQARQDLDAAREYVERCRALLPIFEHLVDARELRAEIAALKDATGATPGASE